MFKTWGSGAVEMLSHAQEHMNGENAFDKRIAFISVDNAVELAVRAYLTLPGKMYPFITHTKKEMEGCNNSFSEQLLLFEKHYACLLNGISVGDIEFYHRIRNDLYHNGAGKSVDDNQLFAYYVIAEILANRLFSLNIYTPPANDMRDVEKIIREWGMIESLLRYIYPGFVGNNYKELTDHSVLPSELVASIMLLARKRNDIVHIGEKKALDAKESQSLIESISNVRQEIEKEILKNGKKIMNLNLNYYPSEATIEGILKEQEVCKFAYMEDEPNPELVKIWVLELLEPINVHQREKVLSEGDFDVTHYNVTMVQLSVSDEKCREQLRNKIDKAVKVKGILFGGHTYHHRTEVLMDVKVLE